MALLFKNKMQATKMRSYSKILRISHTVRTIACKVNIKVRNNKIQHAIGRSEDLLIYIYMQERRDGS